MKNKIIPYCLALTFLLGWYRCLQNQKTSKIENSTFDQTSNWVILNKVDGVKEGNTYSWDIIVQHPADYVVQVVFDTLPKQSTTGKIKIEEQELAGVFKKSYTT